MWNVNRQIGKSSVSDIGLYAGMCVCVIQGAWRNDIHLIHLPKHIPRYFNWKGVMMDSCGG